MHILPLALALATTFSVAPDSADSSAIEAPVDGVPRLVALRVAIDLPTTARAERRAGPVEYSDWYERRRAIHKAASYTMLPLFAFQYVTGRELYDKSTDAPRWAKTGHGIAATGVAALFTVNTVTGVWNLWDARKDPEGRGLRTTHAVLMLLADAGFTATGLLAERAEGSSESREQHRNIALGSVAVATASYLIMIPPLRRD